MTNTRNISKALEIPGWLSEAELTWLAEQAEKTNTIVEFGSYLGRSTRALGDNCNGIVYAVDPWSGTYYNNDGSVSNLDTAVFDIFLHNVRDLIDVGRVYPIRDYSWAFHEPNVKAGLVFIDGDRRYEEVLTDIKTAMRIIESGGIIAGHNYGHAYWPGIKQAVDEMFGNVEIMNSIWSVRFK